MDVASKQHYTVKFCARLKKSKIEPIALLRVIFQILVASIMEVWTTQVEFWNRCAGDPENSDDLWMHFEGKV